MNFALLKMDCYYVIFLQNLLKAVKFMDKFEIICLYLEEKT